ncbi:MAG: D-alanyl-D-alanine carboxypeptidase [Clostridiales bacterium]|nr:D-alanyl-D-alanine carboxypeptidase [Clostridiales bacterium]
MIKKIFSIILICCIGLSAVPVLADDNIRSGGTLNIPQNTVLDSLTAKSIMLMDATTGTVIFERNSDEKLPLASITKVMSMMIILDEIRNNNLSMDDIVTTSPYAASMGGSQVYLKEGEEFTVRDMLKAIAIHSANDCTVAVAEKVAGSESTFVDRMNEKAKALGMYNTYFLDCTGLTDDGHYSTAYDIALMSSCVANDYPEILELTSIWHDTFRDGKFSLDNTNKLVGKYTGVTGLKTGFTTKAGYCLTTTAKRGLLSLVSVVLGTDTTDRRFDETSKLLDYGFANVELYSSNKKGEVVNKVKVIGGVQKDVDAIYKRDVNVTILKKDRSKLGRNIVLENNLVAPIKKGDTVGRVEFKVDDQVIAKEEIVAKNDVKKASWIKRIFRAILRWLGIE